MFDKKTELKTLANDTAESRLSGVNDIYDLWPSGVFAIWKPNISANSALFVNIF